MIRKIRFNKIEHINLWYLLYFCVTKFWDEYCLLTCIVLLEFSFILLLEFSFYQRIFIWCGHDQYVNVSGSRGLESHITFCYGAIWFLLKVNFKIAHCFRESPCINSNKFVRKFLKITLIKIPSEWGKSEWKCIDMIKEGSGTT